MHLVCNDAGGVYTVAKIAIGCYRSIEAIRIGSLSEYG